MYRYGNVMIVVKIAVTKCIGVAGHETGKEDIPEMTVTKNAAASFTCVEKRQEIGPVEPGDESSQDSRRL